MSPTVITLIFLAFAIIMFVTEKIPLGTDIHDCLCWSCDYRCVERK